MHQTHIRHQLECIRAKQPWLVLSAAETFYVASSDNPAISHFYSFEAGSQGKKAVAIPDGCVDVLFDCDASQPTAEVFGTLMSALEIELKSRHRYFGVRFASGVIPDCMLVSAQELIEHHYSLLDVIPQTEQLFEAIVSKSNFADRVAIFQDFFVGKTPRQMTPLTQAAVRFIFAQQGNIRVDQLADITGYTTRTIQRQFRADMGMSPKQFSRIIRCQSAVHQINHKSDITFSDMAFDLGFSDQPHFLREFKKLVHATPMSYQSQVKQQTYYDRIQYF